MRGSLLSLCAVITVTGLAHGATQDPGTAQQRTMTVDDVLELQSVGDAVISPDGKWVVYVVTEADFEENVNVSSLWVVPTQGGEATRLTYRKGFDNGPQWAPDGSWIAFLSDRKEDTQVHGIRPDGGEAWQVTHSETPVGEFRIAPDASQIGYTARERPSDEDEALEKLRGRPIVWDSSYTDQWSRAWTAPLEDRQAGLPTLNSPDGLHVSSVVWAPDSKRIAFAARSSPLLRTYRHGAVYVAAIGSTSAERVTSMPGGESPVAWVEGIGLIVAGTARELGTFNSQLWRIPEPTGEPISLTSSLDEHARFVAATDGRLYVEASHRTGRRLYQISLAGGRVSAGPSAVSDDGAFYSGFTATDDATMVSFVAQGPSASPNVYVSKTDRFRPVRLTNVNSNISDFSLGEHRIVTWRSRADGEPIEGVLTLPVGYRDGDRVPLLLVIHGGPAGVSTNAFAARRGAYPIQVFAGLGYAVLQPNYRGSTGYGQRFRGLNRGDISGRDWIDIESGVDTLIAMGVADSTQLGVMGWSFGGHHTYWGITQTDRFRAASAGAGANDLISMYSQTDIPEFYHTYLGPKPWENFDLYEERSAYRYVEQVTTPLLIQVGERDERVPAEQSIQFYEAVKAIGKTPVKLVVYPGQPHGVREPRLVRDLLDRNVEWFQRWIPTAEEISTSQGR